MSSSSTPRDVDVTALDAVATLPDGPGTDVIARGRAAARAVDLVVADAHASIPGWDNLGYIDAFSRAAERARDVLRTSTHAVERRLVGARLLRLMPPALLPTAHNDRAVALNLPDAVLERADNDFALTVDDAPNVHPSWTAFLTRTALLDAVLRPGRHELLLAPKSLSPLHAVGSNVLVRVVGTTTAEGLLPVEIVDSEGGVHRRRRTSDGRDAGPAEVRSEVLAGWLRHGGPASRGLDLRRPDDRCLLLAFNETLRERRLDVLLARSAGDDSERRAAVVSAVIDAAADTVAFATLDPLACRFVFPVDGNGWVDNAVAMLQRLGLAAEVTPHKPSAHATREFVWLDAVVDAGFVGGAMSAVAQARAFARLAVSMLAPLGALPLVGARSGDGVVLTVLDEDNDGPRQRGPLWVRPAAPLPVRSLVDAWRAGEGRVLPLVQADCAHELPALPAFLQSLVDAIVDAGHASSLPQPAETTSESAPQPVEPVVEPTASVAPVNDVGAVDDVDAVDDVELVDDASIIAVVSGEGDVVVETASDVDVSADTLRPTPAPPIDDEDAA